MLVRAYHSHGLMHGGNLSVGILGFSCDANRLTGRIDKKEDTSILGDDLSRSAAQQQSCEEQGF